MADQFVQVPTDSTGKKIDTSELIVGTNTVERQRIVMADPATAAALAAVENADPASTDYGLVVRTVAGTAAKPMRVDPTGTTTQPVSAAALPLPAGAATAAKQPALGIAGTPSADVISIQGVTSMTAVKVDGSAVTQPVSAAALPLPSGAATAAKQPALGTAGTPSADVITVQGAASMTALKVDGSAVTQPVSGTVTVQQATAANLKVDLSGTGANTTALKVDGSAVTQPVSGSVTPTPGTAGGWSKVKYAAQTTTVQSVKGAAGTFGGYFVYNPNASVAYVQVFDTAGAVTLGTTVPDMIFAIPPASAANLEITCGVNMANGIKLACTTTATGLTAPGTGLDMTIFYK